MYRLFHRTTTDSFVKIHSILKFTAAIVTRMALHSFAEGLFFYTPVGSIVVHADFAPSVTIYTLVGKFFHIESLPYFLSLPAMFSEEAQKLCGSIGSFRIGERTIRTTSRPYMARLVNKPLLRNDLTVSVVVNRARIGSSTDHLSPFHLLAMCKSVLLRFSCLQPLVEQVISVDR